MKKTPACIMLLALALCALAVPINPILLGKDKSVEKGKSFESALVRVDKDVKYLASDQMEGRGPRTKGLEMARDYMRDEFKRLGLKSGVADGSYFQPFKLLPNSASRLRVEPDKCSLTIEGPQDAKFKLELGKTYQALQFGVPPGKTLSGSGEIVFVGYGISAKKPEYDDYADVDVEGKIVLLIRREPQQADEKSAFDGKADSRHAQIVTKINLAREKKAAGVLLVNDPHHASTAEKDDLAASNMFGAPRGRRRGNQAQNAPLPFAQVKQSVVNEILAKTPIKTKDGKELTDLAAIEKHINETLQPVSQPLAGWSAKMSVAVEGEVTNYNVVGVLEGEGPLADETVIIGGHYDHLGMGEFGSRGRERAGREIHNGADDNATGTAAVMELARRFAQAEKKPARRMVFIGFAGEERGLLGSFYYAANPLFPLDKTAAMINFDMIGRLRNKNLTLFGASTAKEFGEIAKANPPGPELKLNIPPFGFAGSDHVPFGRKKIPCVFFFTGTTSEYHTPDDDYETLNMKGMVHVIDYAEQFTRAVVELPEKPAFTSLPTRRRTRAPYFGARPSGPGEGDGVPVGQVAADSPAQKAGIKSGDILIKFDGKKINTAIDLFRTLTGKKPGDKVKVVVKREKEEKELEVTLSPSPSRRRRGN